MILNRFNVSWFAVKHPDPLTYAPTFMSNVRYMPTLPEISVSLGIFCRGHPGLRAGSEVPAGLRASR